MSKVPNHLLSRVQGFVPHIKLDDAPLGHPVLEAALVDIGHGETHFRQSFSESLHDCAGKLGLEGVAFHQLPKR